MLPATHRVGRIRRHDLADDQPVEQHPDRCEVLFDAALSLRSARRPRVPRPIAPDTRLPRQNIRNPFPTARTHSLRSKLAKHGCESVPLDQIQHDHLRNLPARPALKGHCQSEFKHATQCEPIAILLAKYEARLRR
jgi:hypothetical protein